MGALLRARVAAKRLGVSLRTVQRWVASGLVSGVRVGRSVFVHRAAVERLEAVRDEKREGPESA